MTQKDSNSQPLYRPISKACGHLNGCTCGGDEELPSYSPSFKTKEEAEAFTWAGLDQWCEWLSAWHQGNFGDPPLSLRATKLMEEAGELGHAVVRLWHYEQNFAPDKSDTYEAEKWKAELRNAIADVIVVAGTIAIHQGLRLSDLLKEVRTELESRQYNATRTDHKPPGHTHRHYSGDEVAPIPGLREVCEQGRCPPRYQK